MSSDSHFDSDADLRRYEALLEMADLMVHHRSLPELFVEMAERLRKVAAAEFANFSLHDPINNVMRLYIWEGKDLVTSPCRGVRRTPADQGIAHYSIHSRR
jgi:hypothetical protein